MWQTTTVNLHLTWQSDKGVKGYINLYIIAYDKNGKEMLMALAIIAEYGVVNKYSRTRTGKVEL